MSASAGRVLILLKGEYNNATAYQMLDAVRYQGSLYIAKKATLGNVPQDGEYWMLCASGATWGNIGGIITNQTDLMNLLNGKQDTLTFDTVPTASSTNPVTSAGIKTALDAKITTPAGGSVGDVLRKTASGEEWSAETGSAWGSITGSIDNQTDLKNKLDATASNIATIEDTAFASKAYVVGEFLTYNGQLYEVTNPIALGEALVIDTNIEAKSVSDKFVDVAGDISELKNGLTPSTDGSWKVRKFEDGTAECWGRFSFDTTINTVWGNLYLSPRQNIAFPVGLFVERPIIVALLTGGTSGFIINGNVTTKDGFDLFVGRGNSYGTSTTTYAIDVHAFGRWK